MRNKNKVGRMPTNYTLNSHGVCQSLMDPKWLNDYIRCHPSGEYTLKELFPDIWERFKRQRRYGIWFKSMVSEGLIQGIKINRKRSNNSWEYTVI